MFIGGLCPKCNKQVESYFFEAPAYHRLQSSYMFQGVLTSSLSIQEYTDCAGGNEVF